MLSWLEMPFSHAVETRMQVGRNRTGAAVVLCRRTAGNVGGVPLGQHVVCPPYKLATRLLSVAAGRVYRPGGCLLLSRDRAFSVAMLETLAGETQLHTRTRARTHAAAVASVIR